MLQKKQTGLYCDWLENYLNYESIKKKDGFSLQTMQFLVQRFKHPENFFRTIHVAGSKGKGSVSAMIANILFASGRPSGLYTSPHMLDFTERICTPEGPFPDSVYGRACDIIVPLVESIIPGSIPGNMEPTWFELVTLLAFMTFREAGILWAVIETGLGGRLDATNVITPEACVITPIELEHTEYLGNTIEKIAYEKAGIIKEGIPVFIAEQKKAAREVFSQTAKKYRCNIFSMEDAVSHISAEPSPEGLELTIGFNDLAGGAHFSRQLKTRLSFVAEIQGKNAALAAYTVKTLIPEITEEIIEKGLSLSWLPGRFEIVQDTLRSGSPPPRPPIVLDGAHTVNSITGTLETFEKLYPGRAHLVFACASDKDVDSIAALFSDKFSRITITRPGDKKASDIEHASIAFSRIFSVRSGTEIKINTDYKTALMDSFNASKDADVPLLVTGSFYLVSEAKKLLSLLRQDQES